jgi:hypothetical protein
MAGSPRKALMVIELDPEHIRESTSRVQQFMSGLSNGENQQYLAIHLAIDDSADAVMDLFMQWRREVNATRASKVG